MAALNVGFNSRELAGFVARTVDKLWNEFLRSPRGKPAGEQMARLVVTRRNAPVTGYSLATVQWYDAAADAWVSTGRQVLARSANLTPAPVSSTPVLGQWVNSKFAVVGGVPTVYAVYVVAEPGRNYGSGDGSDGTDGDGTGDGDGDGDMVTVEFTVVTGGGCTFPKQTITLVLPAGSMAEVAEAGADALPTVTLEVPTAWTIVDCEVTPSEYTEICSVSCCSPPPPPGP